MLKPTLECASDVTLNHGHLYFVKNKVTTKFPFNLICVSVYMCHEMLKVSYGRH